MKAIIFTDFHRGKSASVAKTQEEQVKLIDQSTFDCIIVSGDWGTANLDHVKSAFQFFRNAFPGKKIFGVLGNHDLWDKYFNGFNQKFRKINEYAQRYDIDLLENKRIDFMGYTILGFNGWYHEYDYSVCDDYKYLHFKRSLSEAFITQLQANEKLAVDFIKNQTNIDREKTIIVTHFPVFKETYEVFEGKTFIGSNPENQSILPKVAKFLIFGHTHKTVFQEISDMIVINAGADYGQIKYRIYDFDQKKMLF